MKQLNPFSMKKFRVRLEWKEMYSRTYQVSGLDLEHATRRATQGKGLPSNATISRAIKGTIRAYDQAQDSNDYTIRGKAVRRHEACVPLLANDPENYIKRWRRTDLTATGNFRIINVHTEQEILDLWDAAVARQQKLEV